MTQTGQLIVDIKNYIKEPYAWPGGYPKFLLLSDGECICQECTKKELSQIVTSTVQHARDGWGAEAVDINWEDTDIYCVHCNEKIESAYGENL